MSEVIRAKTGKNGLAAHRPNVVVANPLVGPDYQMSRHLRPDYTPCAQLPNSIDALALGVTGIDIGAAEFQHGYFQPGQRPTLDALGVPAAAQSAGHENGASLTHDRS